MPRAAPFNIIVRRTLNGEPTLIWTGWPRNSRGFVVFSGLFVLLWPPFPVLRSVSSWLCAEALRVITPLNKPALDSLQFLQVICEDIPHLVRCNRQIFLLLLYQTNKTETKCLRPCDLTARPSVLAVIEMLRRLLPEWRWTVFLESNGEN